jgi:hypothetical protein
MQLLLCGAAGSRDHFVDAAITTVNRWCVGLWPPEQQQHGSLLAGTVQM